MKQYYQIKYGIGDELGTPYSLNLHGTPEYRKSIKETIEDNTVLQLDKIQFKIDTRTGTGKKRLGNIVYWQLGDPFAHVLIISKAILKIFEQFQIPYYSIYRAQILNEKEFGEYFILHLAGDVFDEIDYSQQNFLLKDIETWKLNENSVARKFSNKIEFLKNREGLIATQNQTLFFKKIIYKDEYDIFWGWPVSILVSEEVKSAIEAAKLSGVSFELFTEYEIEFSND